MRTFISTIIVIGIMIVVAVLYFVLGRAQFTKRIDLVRQDNSDLSQELQEISRKENEIPELELQVPKWMAQAELLRRSVPQEIADNTFLANLATELDRRDVKLLEVAVSLGGNWLSRLSEEDEAELMAKGIDLPAAKKIRYAEYSASLLGEFADVLMAFESLKGYGRVYSVDSVISPAGAGSGMIMQAVSTTQVPIQLTGRIYYGVDPNYVDVNDLEEIFVRASMRPVVDELQAAIGKAGHDQFIVPQIDQSDTETPNDEDQPAATGESAESASTAATPEAVLDARRADLVSSSVGITALHSRR